MRVSLGIAFENSSISTALVDADTPLLGTIDEFHHSWETTGIIPTAEASARTIASTAEIVTERALRSQLRPETVGVVCERAEVLDLVPDLLLSSGFENVELVNGLEARLAYLRTVDTLTSVSPILAYWPDGDETVIAVIDTTTSAIDSAYRHKTEDLTSDSSAFAAILNPIVAECHPAPKVLVLIGAPREFRELASEASELAGLGYRFLDKRAHLATGAALVVAARQETAAPGAEATATPPTPLLHHRRHRPPPHAT